MRVTIESLVPAAIGDETVANERELAVAPSIAGSIGRTVPHRADGTVELQFDRSPGRVPDGQSVRSYTR